MAEIKRADELVVGDVIADRAVLQVVESIRTLHLNQTFIEAECRCLGNQGHASKSYRDWAPVTVVQPLELDAVIESIANLAPNANVVVYRVNGALWA